MLVIGVGYLDSILDCILGWWVGFVLGVDLKHCTYHVCVHQLRQYYIEWDLLYIWKMKYQEWCYQ